MPIYGYRCDACGAEIEKRQSFHDDPLTTCETCGGALRRLLHPAGIVFKGSGFYNTDNRKGGSAASSSTGGENGKASGESSSGATESSSSGSDSASSTKTDTSSSKSESSTSSPAA